MERAAPAETTLALRTFLGRFGLGSNSEDRPVSSFSGGEKSRLALALLAWQKPHILLLDEPTNHLDLDMRDALTLALEQYSGAVVVVSHDRSLIRAIADELWLVADGEAKLFDGDLDDYKVWIETRRPKETSVVAKVKIAAPVRVNVKALQSKKTKLEAELHKAQSALATLDAELGDPATYTSKNSAQLAELNTQRDTLMSKIEGLEESWFELEMALEEVS
jgi:ATP-binding cassette subfamily F protein 3